MHDSFHYNGGIWFSWDNQQLGLERRLARLDHIYSPKNKGEDFVPSEYIIHGNSIGSNHAPVKLELSIGNEERRQTMFKWNASYLKDSNLILKSKDKWLSLPHNMPFFCKLRHISRLYR